jgi:hypothetical protein
VSLVIGRRVKSNLVGPILGRVLTEPATQRIEDCQATSIRPGGDGRAGQDLCQRGVFDFLLTGIAVSGQVLGRGGGEVDVFPTAARSDNPQQPSEVVGVKKKTGQSLWL